MTDPCNPYTLLCVVGKVIGYFQNAIILIISLAVVTFVWNVYRYFFTETEKRKEAGMYVLFSTIGFFVILSIWGLVAIVSNTFNLPKTQPIWPFGGSVTGTPPGGTGAGYTSPTGGAPSSGYTSPTGGAPSGGYTSPAGGVPPTSDAFSPY